MDTTQSHLDNYDVTVDLSGIPEQGVVLDFSQILVVDTLAASPLAGLSPTTIGANASKWASIGESATIPSSGAVSAAGKVVLQRIFRAKKHPSTVKFASVDLVGGDGWDDLFEALRDTGVSFSAVVIVSNTVSVIADIVEAVGAVTEVPIFAGLSDKTVAGAASGTWNANDISVLSSALRGLLYLTYHDGNGTDEADFAEVAALYATVPWDTACAGGNVVLTRTGRLGAISGTIKANLDTNKVNHALPGFSTQTYVDAGVLQDGRPIYHLYTRLWLQNRLRNAVAKVKEDLASRSPPQKLPMTLRGQDLVVAALSGVFAQGERAGHFIGREDAEARGLDLPFVRGEPITSTDITERRLRFSALAYFAEDARLITVNAFVKSS